MADENKTDTQKQDTQQQTSSGDKQVVNTTYDLTVNGETRKVTMDEVLKLAQKAAGADAKFQEASELRESAKDGIRMKELIDRLSDGTHTPTETEVGELAGMLGVDANEFINQLTANEGNTTNTKSTKTKLTKEEIIEALGFDPAEAKQTLDYSRLRHVASAKDEIRKFSDEMVDKDEVFGKMIIGEGGKDRLSVIKEMVAEDVIRRIQDGTPFGSDLVAASVQKTRAYLTKFGIPGKPEQYPMSLGLIPGGGSIPAEVQSDKPIGRISSTEQEAEDNFVKRAMQKGLQMLRSQKQG